ncbi:hypothetical protein BTA51_29535 [Hahella sp. CCB-MM4]|uniref:copper-binding protein n=1 Tax=Hahella sp. (strain CCB-MM4) TaxID=1926491 RepID=UPI000BD2E644|nr:copper-binding protein [Hahella sp. CCB-MM4]OZG69768.1 hypothetical protein BTA51_29535 [Hahella sp. CCB-MM4]
MLKSKFMQSFKPFSVALVLGSALATGVAYADSTHGQGEHMMENGEMMKDSHMNNGMGKSEHREVMGMGQINKIHAEKHMVNISHEPIEELKWPKMRMNFKTDEGVDLSALKLGQKVMFTLMVDGDNNYLIKEIKTAE